MTRVVADRLDAANDFEKKDQIAARKRLGHSGGGSPSFDADAYRNRNVVERSFAFAKQWRGLATRYQTRDHLPCRDCSQRSLNMVTWIGILDLNRE